MNKVYVVQGTRGEYDDREEWIVKAFLDQFNAKLFNESLNEEAEKIDKKRQSIEKPFDQVITMSDEEWTEYQASFEKHQNRFDKRMKVDNNMARYYIIEVELE